MAPPEKVLAYLPERMIQGCKISQQIPVAQVPATLRKKPALPSSPVLHTRAPSQTTVIYPTQHSKSTTHRRMKAQPRKRIKKVRRKRRKKKRNGSPRKLRLVTQGGLILTSNLLIFDLIKTKWMFLVLSKIFDLRWNPEVQTTTSQWH